jgi:hypothetical protein
MPEQEQVYSALSKLPNIDDTEPLNDADLSCLREIHEVLVKHGRLNRFGLSLLHQHFDIESDECLVESCDPERRTLTIRPIKRADLAGKDAIGTNWRMDSGESMLWCTVYCIEREKGHWITHFGEENE